MTAHELRFRGAPDVVIGFPGDPGNDSASGSTRTNLPYQVAGGVTYHRIRVDYALASRLGAAAVKAALRGRGESSG